MFQSRRQAALGNINLGNLSAPPGFEDMQFLVQQAQRYRGRFVELSWQVSRTGANFQLTAKVMPNQPEPTWMLYHNAGGASTLVWGHTSSDLTLMNNLVMLECDKPDGNSGQANSISDHAMSNMVSRNAVSGSMAGARADEHSAAGGQTVSSGNLPAQALNNSASNSASNSPSNPAATWLQNLTQNTSPIVSEAAGPMSAAPASYSTAPARTATADMAPAHDSAEPSARQETTLPERTTSGAVLNSDHDLLDGSLANISVPNILRYLLENRASGRLAVQSPLGAGELFFTHGQITHAATLDTKGAFALYDTSTWAEGQFHFYKDEQTPQRSISSETATLINNAERMCAFQHYLQTAGLKSSSFLQKAQTLQRHDFERTAPASADVDVQQQWRVYTHIDGNCTLSDLLHAYPMVRAEWMPILANLLQCGWISISEQPATNRPGMFLEPEKLDESAIESYLRQVTEADGLFSYGAFLQQLQQEFLRFQRTGSRFAIALFSVAQTNLLDGNVLPISAPAMAEACRRILATKRRLDIAGHFQDEYALLLPETDSAGAAVFANRIAQLLKKPALSADLENSVLVISFGIASIPDDVRQLETLLAAVRVAKNKSRMMGAPVITYGDAS